jgi:adenylate kinase family enzyme
MQYKKIHIIGGPGSGKTYCAKIISNNYNIPYYDLDNIFWNNTNSGYGVKKDKNKRDKELSNILNKDKYILEGVYYSWLKKSFTTADIIIVINTPVYIRDFRIIKRFIKRKLGLLNSKKETLKDLYNLLKWNHQYDIKNMVNALAMINDLNDNIFHFNSSQEVINEFVKN